MNWFYSRISFMLRGLHNPFCLTKLAFRSTKGENGFKVQDLSVPDVETVDDVPIQFQKWPCLPPPPRANSPVCCQFRGCLHGSGGPQVGEVTHLGGVQRLIINSLVLIWSGLHDLWGDRTRDYMDRRVTSPKRVTLPTWVPPPPCKQTLRWSIAPMASASKSVKWPTQQRLFKHFPTPQTVYSNINATEICLWP